MIDRFTSRRKHLYELQWRSTRLRERKLGLSVLLVTGANVLVAWAVANAAADGTISLDRTVVYLTAIVGTSMIAFGGWSWALDGAAAPVMALNRLEPVMATAGALPVARGAAAARGRHARARDPLPRRDVRVPARICPTCSSTSTSRSPRARRWRSSASTARARPRSPSCCAASTTRSRAASRSTASTCATSIPTRGDRASPRCSRTSCGSSATSAPTSRPHGATEESITGALHDAGADDLASLDTILAKGYAGGIDVSGGQWQRVALARALCEVREGAGVVLLDEPTAQLDVRGEAEIFRRVLAATRHTTSILVSHRFSTVRQADHICVVDHGRVVELGTHDELIARRGRYHTMFELQASRFSAIAEAELDEHGEEVVHDTLG